ncbi:MAG: glycosyltransferase [Candidatus Marinimicrobia bacterium]|nr:glycosyltransferase [Candidatus Neomarinimicrobiota bacterium]
MNPPPELLTPAGSPARVVLVHDWLTGMRGGERVLEVLADWFPAAPIYTLFARPAALSPTLTAHPIHTSRLQQIPGILNHYRNLLPLFPAALAGLRLPPCDLVISTSHCVAKSIRPPAGARHLCYCFTPMRYAWGFFDEYLGADSIKRRLAAPLLLALRHWDRRANQRVDRFVAISRHIQARIARCYNRDAGVVYPPVNTDFFTPDPTVTPGAYDLIVSALVPYKRIDLALEAYRLLPERRLKIVGAGTEYERLRATAPANIEWLGRRADPEVRALYQGCGCLVFPGEEDFGIVPLEAQACGRPVVGYDRGGLRETVRPNETGILFSPQTPTHLAAAVRACTQTTWPAERLRAQALTFAPDAFRSALAHECQALLRNP